jgi:hypothetical protein
MCRSGWDCAGGIGGLNMLLFLQLWIWAALTAWLWVFGKVACEIGLGDKFGYQAGI